jgi:hypothetical protein
MRTLEQIDSDLAWKNSRMSDSQEHAQIVRFEAQIKELQAERKKVSKVVVSDRLIKLDNLSLARDESHE